MSNVIVVNSYNFAPVLVPASLDIRASTVTYAQVIGSVEFGSDWDRAYPVASSTNKRVTGWRYQVSIPQGALIDAATLELTHSQNATWSAPNDNLEVGLEQADSTTAATNEPDAQSKSDNVGSTVTWSINGYYANGEKFVTPDLSSVLQTIIDRPGWSSGNYLTFWAISTGGGNDANQMWSVNGVTSTLQPRLEVDYRS